MNNQYIDNILAVEVPETANISSSQKDNVQKKLMEALSNRIEFSQQSGTNHLVILYNNPNLFYLKAILDTNKHIINPFRYITLYLQDLQVMSSISVNFLQTNKIKEISIKIDETINELIRLKNIINTIIPLNLIITAVYNNNELKNNHEILQQNNYFDKIITYENNSFYKENFLIKEDLKLYYNNNLIY